jgi:hypothetical protein
MRLPTAETRPKPSQLRCLHHQAFNSNVAMNAGGNRSDSDARVLILLLPRCTQATW